MIEHTRVQCDIAGMKDIDGFFRIENNVVRLFLPIKAGLATIIPYISCTHSANAEIKSQLLNSRLFRTGEEYDEYLVKDAYLGENKESFQKNRYWRIGFEISKDFLPFPRSPWDVSTTSKNTESIEFLSREDRIRKIKIDDNCTFTEQTGFSKAYSKDSYRIQTSAQWGFEYGVPETREVLFGHIQSLLDFYSLFCDRYLATSFVELVSEAKISIHYKAERLTDQFQRDNTFNTIIHEEDLHETLHTIVPEWMRDFPNYKLAMQLFKDSQAINDEQLKFICLARCLEIFHHLNFNTTVPNYLDDLHQFLQTKNLSTANLKYFQQKLTLSQRMYDLIRFTYDIIIEDKLLFGYITKTDGGQLLADTRNYYTHFSDAKKAKAWEGNSLRLVNIALSAFARLLFLKKAGFSNETLNLVRSKVHLRNF